MFPQFQRVVTLSVMSILVGLFAWIYVRDRQPRARLWMIGWASIVAHFAGMLLFSFGLIPSRLAAARTPACFVETRLDTTLDRLDTLDTLDRVIQ